MPRYRQFSKDSFCKYATPPLSRQNTLLSNIVTDDNAFICSQLRLFSDLVTREFHVEDKNKTKKKKKKKMSERTMRRNERMKSTKSSLRGTADILRSIVRPIALAMKRKKILLKSLNGIV